MDAIREDHIRAAKKVIGSVDVLETLTQAIEVECGRLASFLGAAQIIDEISPKTKDAIIGTGEKLSCMFMAALLNDRVGFYGVGFSVVLMVVRESTPSTSAWIISFRRRIPAPRRSSTRSFTTPWQRVWLRGYSSVVISCRWLLVCYPSSPGLGDGADGEKATLVLYRGAC